MRVSKIQSGLVLGAAMAALVSPAPANAQEFDCRQASNASERAICGSDRLSGLDERMNRLYVDLKQSMKSERQREDLRDYQLRFLDARDDCGRNTGCIKGAYLDQIEVLSARLKYAQNAWDQ